MMESSTSSADEQQSKSLNVKYQKLAAEYAKLRSQVQVLKKGVVEEKEKEEVLRQTVTSQDQSIRKLEQELDSVKFRNRQLEKRIEILQEPQHPAQKGVQAAGQLVDSNLLIHVEQNKILQEQLALLGEKYSGEVGRLRRMIDHEMVPRGLMESREREGVERVGLLNRRVAELVEVNSELRGRVEGLEGERDEREKDVVGVCGGMEVEELVRRLTESEVGRERVNSEVQILRLKLKRLSVESELVKSPSSSSVEVANMIGRMSGVVESDDSAILVEHLRNRISQLVRLVQASDSKAIHYYSEAVSLCRLVRTGQVTYKRLDSEFGKLKGKFRGVCDEMEDTKGVYERQVDSLTEHIALLNEKLAGVVEEVQGYKAQVQGGQGQGR